MDKRALRHQEKRAQIQEAVLALANEKMPEDITVRDICARAQVTIGSFYRLFESKEEAVAAIFMDSNEHFRWETERLMEMDSSFERLVPSGRSARGIISGLYQSPADSVSEGCVRKGVHPEFCPSQYPRRYCGGGAEGRHPPDRSARQRAGDVSVHHAEGIYCGVVRNERRV